MNNQTTDVYRCADRAEAEPIRIRLAAAGIVAFVHGDDAVTSMGISGGGINTAIVRVEVAIEDHGRATRILQEDKRRRLELGPWICDHCSETNDPAFDLCWQCSTPRSDIDSLSPETEPENPPTAKPTQSATDNGDANPYRPILMDDASGPKTVSSTTFLVAVGLIFGGVIVWLWIRFS